MLQCRVASLGNRDRAQGCPYRFLLIYGVLIRKIACIQNPKLTPLPTYKYEAIQVMSSLTVYPR